MNHFGSTLEHYGAFKSNRPFKNFLDRFGVIWESLGAFGSVWERFRAFGIMLKHLGGFWNIFGHFLTFLEILEHFWVNKKFGKFFLSDNLFF